MPDLLIQKRSPGRSCSNPYITALFIYFFILCVVYDDVDIKNLCDTIVRLLVGKTTNYKSWSASKDAKHRRQSEKIGVFQSIWEINGGKLPWRLTRDERKELDQRMSRVWWPHYMERLYYRGCSFWEKPSRMWKSRRKYRLLLYILPVMLRDKVPALMTALFLILWSLRRLEGQSLARNVIHAVCSNPNPHSMQDKFIVMRQRKKWASFQVPMR